MTTPNYPYIWYFRVDDTNPLTSVFESATGTYVSPTSASFLSWVANGGQTSTFYQQPQVSGVADNGAGLVRVTAPTVKMTTGQVWAVQNVVMTGATVVNGARAVTVVDANNFDIQGSVFVGGDSYVSGGVVDQGAPIATAASLNALIDAWNVTLFNNNSYYGLNLQSAGSGNITLTNPMKLAQGLSASGNKVFLPAMNLFGSIPIGVPIYFYNTGSGAASYQLYYQDGVTLVDGLTISGGNAGLELGYILSDNSTANGTLTRLTIGTNSFWAVPRGGTGQGSLTNNAVLIGAGTAPVHLATTGTAGNFLVDQGAGSDPGFKAASGDVASISAAGSFTFASTITAAGPTGDGAHTWTLTYDAKGRLTAASNIAIAISDTAITYGNESAHTVFAGPTSGAAAPPGFRALVASDIPQLPFTDLTGTIASGQVSGSYTGITGVGTLTAGTWNATKIGLAYGGTNADLSATGGTSQVLKQTSVGGNVTVGQLAFTDISGSVAASQLPNPSASTLGGVQSKAAVAHNFLTSISTGGVPAAAQPDFSDLTGSVSNAQLGSVGTWTPVDASGSALGLLNVSGGYTKIGNLVFYYGRADYPVVAVDPTAAKIGGLPFTAANQQYANTPGSLDGTSAVAITPIVLQNTTNFQLFNSVGLGTVTNAQMSNTANRFAGFYALT